MSVSGENQFYLFEVSKRGSAGTRAVAWTKNNVSMEKVTELCIPHLTTTTKKKCQETPLYFLQNSSEPEIWFATTIIMENSLSPLETKDCYKQRATYGFQDSFTGVTFTSTVFSGWNPALSWNHYVISKSTLNRCFPLKDKRLGSFFSFSIFKNFSLAGK